MTHVFNFNKNGAVVAYETDQGHEWRLALDSKNRVVELNRNRESYGLTYLNDRLRSIRHSLGVWEFEYDDRGRILSGEGTPPLNHANPKIDYPSDHSIVVQMDDRDIAYELNESNNVTRIRQNDKEHELSYDWRGLLTEISFDGRSMRMQRNQLGRIVSTNYPDNRTATYYYDALGNRNLTKFGTGGRMALEHDGRGNIIGVVDTSASGTRVMQTYEIDEKNRVSAVTLPGPTLIKVNYDSTGRPTHLKLNDKHVYVEYDEAEIATLRADSRIWHVPRSGSSGAFEDSIVDHDILLHRDRSSPSQPDYGFVVFGNDLALDAKFRSIWHELVPGLNEARSITQVTRVWFDNSRSLSFEKPSNPAFQPLEYESTNCCISCPFASPCGQFCTTYFGTSEFTCNCYGSTPCNSRSSYCPIVGTVCSPESSASVATARSTLVKELSSISGAPYEVGMRVDCPDAQSIAWQDDSAVKVENCIRLKKNDSTIYAGHTHPVYTNRHVGRIYVCCSLSNERCGYIMSKTQVRQLNSANRRCQPTDKRWVRNHGIPLLMRNALNQRTPVDC